MLQKITDLWPTLLRQYQGLESEEDVDVPEVVEAEPVDDEDIELNFKGLRWTRVIDLRDYKEQSGHVFSMADDIIYAKQ